MRGRIDSRFGAWLVAAGLVAGAGCGGPTQSQSGQTQQTGLTICAQGPVLEGVDVSQYQGRIDWTAAQGAGLAFAIARVSDGLDYPDTTFDNNWSGIKAAGLVRGVYQYFEPGQDAVAQANLLLQRIGTLGPGDLPPVIDVETRGGQSAAAVIAAVQQWVSTVQSATGVQPLVYTSPSFWSGLGDPSVAADLWIANWGASCPSVPGAWSNWIFWQHSDHGSIAGISGGVDTDRFNGTQDQLLAYAGGGTVAPPPPPPPPPPVQPTVAIADPIDGASVAGTVTVTATASTSAVSVELYLDGALLGSGGSAPVSVSWDTTTSSDGAHQLTAQADDAAGNSVLSLAVNVTVNNSAPPPPPPPSGPLVANGDFETGDFTGWATSGDTSISTNSNSGSYAAQLGSPTPGGDSTISQTVALPSGSPQLSFWYQMSCTDSVSYDWASVTVQDASGNVLAMPLSPVCDTSGLWVQVTADLTPFAGQSVVLVLANHDDGNSGDASYTLYDDVTVQ